MEMMTSVLSDWLQRHRVWPCREMSWKDCLSHKTYGNYWDKILSQISHRILKSLQFSVRLFFYANISTYILNIRPFCTKQDVAASDKFNLNVAYLPVFIPTMTRRVNLIWHPECSVQTKQKVLVLLTLTNTLYYVTFLALLHNDSCYVGRVSIIYM